MGGEIPTSAYLGWAVPSAVQTTLLTRFARSGTEDSGRDARGFVFLIPTDLDLASMSSMLVAARGAPMARDGFDDFKDF